MITEVKRTAKVGKIRSVTITVAGNGFTVNCDREPVKTDGKCASMCWEPSKPMVFETGEGALEYTAKELKIPTDGDESY